MPRVQGILMVTPKKPPVEPKKDLEPDVAHLVSILLQKLAGSSCRLPEPRMETILSRLKRLVDENNHSSQL